MSGFSKILKILFFVLLIIIAAELFYFFVYQSKSSLSPKSSVAVISPNPLSITPTLQKDKDDVQGDEKFVPAISNITINNLSQLSKNLTKKADVSIKVEGNIVEIINRKKYEADFNTTFIKFLRIQDPQTGDIEPWGIDETMVKMAEITRKKNDTIVPITIDDIKVGDFITIEATFSLLGKGELEKYSFTVK